jgi:replicative DNA helicase
MKISRIQDLDVLRGKVPPQNLEAEVAVLGAILIDGQAIGDAVELLTADYFYKDAHRKIFTAIISLFNENKAVDLITLTENLNQTGALEEVGGPDYLAYLTTAVPTSANLTHYMRIVREKFVLRQLISNATQIISESYDSTEEVEGLLDKAEQMIFEIASKKFSGSIVPLKDLVRKQMDVIDSLFQRKAQLTGLATGFHQFDLQTLGLQPSDFIVVAARPSMGKSAFVTNIAEHVGIILKQPVAIFSLEMSKEQLVQRMLCSWARVNAHDARKGFLSQNDWPKLTKSASTLSSAPIYIDDTPGMTVLELKAKARRLKAQFDIKTTESRQQEISEISRALKALARELNVPLIAVSQLSRAVESRTDRRPQLSDLRESGAIEQDADVVVLLLREEYYKPDDMDLRGKAEVIIAKQRNGPVGSINLTFIREYTRSSAGRKWPVRLRLELSTGL